MQTIKKVSEPGKLLTRKNISPTQGARATHEGEERVQGGREVEQAGGQGVEEEEQEKQEQGPQEQQKVILLCDVIIMCR